MKTSSSSIPVKAALCLAIMGILFTACPSSNQSKKTQTDEDGFQLIFDGKSLDTWDYNPTYWRVEDGVMIGEVTPETLLKRNTFIIKKDLIVRDFELKVDYRVSERGNSGISYRNVPDTVPFALKGYQADIDGRNFYSGQNYEERGRQFLALRGQTVVIDANHTSPTSEMVRAADLANDSLSRYIKANDWNEYHIIAKGNRLQHYINGVLMSDVTDNDVENRRMSGVLGVQVHVGPPMKIEYKNFKIKTINP